MTDNEIALLHEYEDLKLTIKEAEDRLDVLKPLLIPIIPEDKELKTAKGTFTLKSKPKWRYSPDTTALGVHLKEKQEEEIANGTAKEIPGAPFIQFNAKK